MRRDDTEAHKKAPPLSDAAMMKVVPVVLTFAAMSIGLADRLVAQVKGHIESVQPPGWTQEDQDRLDERERARWELRKTNDPVFWAMERGKWQMEHEYLLQQLRSIEERRQPQQRRPPPPIFLPIPTGDFPPYLSPRE